MSYRPTLVRLSVLLLLVAASLQVCATNFAEEMIYMLRPWDGRIPVFAREDDKLGMAAHANGDSALALEAYERVMEQVRAHGDLDSDVTLFFLAQLAFAQEAANKHHLAMETLEEISSLSESIGNEEARFCADLERARLCAQVAGHPLVPEFAPTLVEKTAHFERVFDRYSPYREEVLNARVEYAQEFYKEGYRSLAECELLEEAIRQLDIVREVVVQVEADPSLSEGQLSPFLLKKYMSYVDLKTVEWEEELVGLRAALRDLNAPDALSAFSGQESVPAVPDMRTEEPKGVAVPGPIGPETEKDTTAPLRQPAQARPRRLAVALVAALAATFAITVAAGLAVKRKKRGLPG